MKPFIGRRLASGELVHVLEFVNVLCAFIESGVIRLFPTHEVKFHRFDKDIFEVVWEEYE